MVSIYLKAFIITVVIFFAGLLVGLSIEKFLATDIYSRTKIVESSVQEIELEMLYFQGLNETYSCNFLNEIVRKTNNNLDILADQLVHYSESNVLFTKSDVETIKTKYTFLLIKDWLLQEKIKKECETQTVSILYFYDRENCDDCVIQGNILSLLKDSFKEKLMIFPLDVKIKIDMIEILQNQYNVTTYPSLVIDNKLYSEILEKEKLKQIICSKLENTTTECL